MPRLRGKQAVVSQLIDRFPAGVIDNLDRVRIIANVAVGYDNIDVQAATRKGIREVILPEAAASRLLWSRSVTGSHIRRLG